MHRLGRRKAWGHEGLVGLSIDLRPIHAIPSATEFWGLAIQGAGCTCIQGWPMCTSPGCCTNPWLQKRKKTVTSNQGCPMSGNMVVSHGKIPSSHRGFLLFGWVSISLIKWMWSSVGGGMSRMPATQMSATKAQNPNPLVRLQKHHICLEVLKIHRQIKKFCGYQWKSFKRDLQGKKNKRKWNACSATSLSLALATRSSPPQSGAFVMRQPHHPSVRRTGPSGKQFLISHWLRM